MPFDRNCGSNPAFPGVIHSAFLPSFLLYKGEQPSGERTKEGEQWSPESIKHKHQTLHHKPLRTVLQDTAHVHLPKVFPRTYNVLSRTFLTCPLIADSNMGSSGWTTAFLLLCVAWEAKGNGNSGSKCPGTNCTPAPAGTTCTSTFDRDDGCCPVWHCANGQTIYGRKSHT